jgi:hypothetical protein
MTKIKVPRKIRLLTHTYSVEVNDAECAGENSLGICKHVSEKIMISSHLTPSVRGEVFIHEFLHMVERFMGVKIDDAELDRIAEGMAALLFDNMGIEFDWSDFSL